METFTSKTSFKLALAVAITASIMLIWISLGVGIIGQDGHPANLMYFAVVAVGIIGAILVRLHPSRMKKVMILMAIVHGLIGLIALVAEIGLEFSPPLEILGLTVFFMALFSVSALLFGRAAQD